MLTLYFDGLYEPQPDHPDGNGSRCGFLSYGWLICNEDFPSEGELPGGLDDPFNPGALLGRGYGVIGRGLDATSVAAEYMALIEGLQALHDLLAGRRRNWGWGEEQPAVRIVGDARCVIDQMNGASAVNSAGVRPLFAQAARLACQLQGLRSPALRIEWVWTPRRLNRRADRLSRIAIRRLHGDRRTYEAALRALASSFSHPTRKSLNLVDLRVFAPALPM
jgi:ribonuclease HI